MDNQKNAYFKCKYCSITEKMLDKKNKKQKLTKQEERRLMKKYTKSETPQESALAQALKAAMSEKNPNN